MKCKNCIHSMSVEQSSHVYCRKAFYFIGVLQPQIESIDEIGTAISNMIANMGIKYDEEAVKNGWCYFPINYDPMWILNCAHYFPL